MNKFLSMAVLFGVTALLAAPASAGPQPTRNAGLVPQTYVDVELVIAVDVSLSMDEEEQALQREGYVRAFLDPLVIRAIEQGNHGKIAVTYVEWAGLRRQSIVVDWLLIDGRDSAAILSGMLAEAPITRQRRTSISSAMGFAGALFDDNGYNGLRRVIDVSGDGPNNQGMRVDIARDHVIARGITINGLPFVPDPSAPMSLFDLPELDAYYETCVIGGPGAFSLPVYSAQEFGEAIRNKLVLEIAGITPPSRFAASGPIPIAGAAPTLCNIGERQWDLYMGNGP